MIKLKELSQQYGYAEGHLRVLLCRSEFNQFRLPCRGYFNFDNSDNFHKMLKFIIKLKQKSNKNWHNNIVILFMFLLLNCNAAWCQRYEHIIIYSPSGEPQNILRGKIIYNNFGIPKKYSTYGGF